jgi:hypothetical protein
MTTIGKDVPDFTAALSGLYVYLSRPTFFFSLLSVSSLSFFSALFVIFSPFFLFRRSHLSDHLLSEITSSARPPVRMQQECREE